MAQLAAGEAEPFEGLGRGHLMDEMAVDVDEACAVVLPVDHMAVPDLVKQGARCSHLSRSLQSFFLLLLLFSLPLAISVSFSVVHSSLLLSLLLFSFSFFFFFFFFFLFLFFFFFFFFFF